MGGIFISHSSKNSAEAERLRDWLEAQGWGRSQVFLDLQDLKSGDSWRDVLNAMGDKEAVIVCLSNEWLSSHECVREFTQAQERGKPILPIFVASVTVPIPRFITDLQIADATKEGFQSLRDSLLAKRITPQSFAWPPPNEPTRSVYRGLQALDVQDAAIFFGRDAVITQGLDELRRLRDGAPKRMLVILGASGAGKSSFLRAGLIARLKRDEENFLVLPIVRPERAAISGAQGLTASVSAAIGRPVALSSAAEFAQALGELRKPVMERLVRNADAARETYAANPPTIIIPLDQAEELFGADNAERAAFCEMVANVIVQDGNALVVATIRSDSYEALQNGLLPDRQTPFTLPAIAAGSFQEIIEGPARLAKPPLSVESALTQQLLTDLNAADALPLLAFTLERLHSQYGADGKLTLTDYRDKLGGLSGAIQSAVNAVLDAQPSKNDLALARRLFVPSLVQVDQDGVKRRVARRADLPAETLELADQFITQRLLVSDDGKIEVAHEAILRQWPALSGWIAEERGVLAALDGVRAATRGWKARRYEAAFAKRKTSQRLDDASWLLHRGDRLKDAEDTAARPDFAVAVDPDMRAYLAACRKEERRAATALLRMQALAGISALLVLGLGYAYTQRQLLEETWASWTRFRLYAVSRETLVTAAPGTLFQDCRHTDCPTMVVIPEGRFVMGSAPDDPANRDGAESPQREISISRFAASRTEVTYEQWDVCVRAGHCAFYQNLGGRYRGGDQWPVQFITWDDARAYVSWLSEMTGHEYRLLSEAEWEYAARARTTTDAPQTLYSWGNDPPVCDPGASNGAVSSQCEHQGSWKVASFRANSFGLHDMHGNVSEWVEDCVALYDTQQTTGAAIVTEPVRTVDTPSDIGCDTRIVRGGSHYDNARRLRSAYRDGSPRIFAIPHGGFRVARSVS